MTDDFDDILAILPELIDAGVSERVAGLVPDLRHVTGVVLTADTTTAEVQLDEDEPNTPVTVPLGAAVSPGDRVSILLSRAGGALVIGNGGAQAGGGSSTGGGSGGTVLYAPPTAALVASAAGVYEIGDTSVTSVDLTATLVAGSRPITALRFYRDATLLATVASPSTSESITDPTPVTATTVYTVQVDDTTSTVTSDGERLDFVYPYYFGLSATTALGAGVAALTKDIAVESTHTHAFLLSGTPQYIYFAQPSAYDPLVSIIDIETGRRYWPGAFEPVDTEMIGGVSYDVYQCSLAQASAAGRIYTLAFGSIIDVLGGTTGGTVTDASSITATPTGELLGLNVQAQLDELDARTNDPLQALWNLDWFVPEIDWFLSSNVLDGTIGRLGWRATYDTAGTPTPFQVTNPGQPRDTDAMGYVDVPCGPTHNTVAMWLHTKLVGTPTFVWAMRCKRRQNNTGSEASEYRIGLLDKLDGSTPDNGMWFKGSDVPGDSWHFRTQKNGVAGADVDTTIEMTTDWQWFIITCDGSTTDPVVRAYIKNSTRNYRDKIPVPGILATVTDPAALPAIGQTPEENYGSAAIATKTVGVTGGHDTHLLSVERYFLRVECR